MKINFIDVEPPMFSSFTVGQKPDFNIVKETKTITVEINSITKTRISTSFKIKECSMGINWEMDGYKQFEDNSFSFLDYERKKSHYFVKSKKQNFERYKEYVSEVLIKLLTGFNVELDELNVRLINHNAF
jgi:hypothetical protein